MESIFKDTVKIKLFSQIQLNLCQLEPNCGDEQIDKIIDQIPKSYLDDKENLMIICRIFAIYSRNKPRIYRQNAIKLFEKIMFPIKTRLQNQPYFFWNIFGSLNYFKQWMYEEGLISIDVIIESAVHNDNMSIIEYFLPEIIEKENELFENEFKKKITTPYSEEYITELKKLRKKYFNWLRESNEVTDSVYREIETNQLRLAIKSDDIDKFQSIISNSNISINSKIKESLIERSFIADIEQSLLEFAIDYNATNITKYLIMNGATFSALCSFNSIYNGNYEMIHISESMDKENFSENLIYSAIECWNMEITQYAIENYNFDFIEKEDIDSSEDNKIIKIFSKICIYMNFEFFDKIFLPFLHKNERFLNDNIYSILVQSFTDESLYFTKEFFKYQEIDVNHQINDANAKKSMLTFAVQMNNLYAVELLLNDPKIDITKPNSDKFLPFLVACVCKSSSVILELFFKNPKFDVYCKDNLNFQTGFVYCGLNNNFVGIRSILQNFHDYKTDIGFFQLLDYSACSDFITIANLLLNHYINLHKEMDLHDFLINIRSQISIVAFIKIQQNIIKVFNNNVKSK